MADDDATPTGLPSEADPQRADAPQAAEARGARAPEDGPSGVSGPVVLRWTAAALALLVVGALGWSFWSAGRSSPAPKQPLPQTTSSPPRDLGRPPAIVESREDFPNILAGGEAGALQLFNDGGVYAEIEYDRLDPKPAGRFDLTAPAVWLYLSADQAVRVEAETGWLVQPAGTRQPEAGAFEGDVRIRAHRFVGVDAREAVASGDSLPLPELTINTPSLRFDAAIGEVRAPGEVQLAGPGFRATLRDVEMLINEAERRLALMRASGGGSFAYSFAQAQRGQSQPEAKRGPPRADSADSAAADAPIIDLYHARFADAIDVLWSGRRLQADTLDLWARLLDGGLPEGALFNFPASPSSDASATATHSGAASDAASEAAGALASQAGFAPDVVATWEGPLRVAPLDETPPQLEGDHVALRFSAPTRGSVQLEAPDAGLAASCVSLDAWLTTGRVSMIGAGDVGVSLRRAGSGVALAGRFDLDLARGLGAFPGPGVIRVEPREVRRDLPPVRRDISWRGRADLIFATRAGALDFAAAAPLREAIFSQDVEARDGAAALTGQSLRAIFRPTPAGAGALSRVIVEDEALLDAAARGRLAADRLDVHFRPARTDADGDAQARSDDAEERSDPLAYSGEIGGDVEPDVATAEGAVRAQQGGASLRAGLVEARFARDNAGELVVSNLAASLDVAVRTPEGDTARADSLRADLLAGSADLVGAPARIARGGASVEGDSLRLERQQHRLTVFGPGALRYEPDAPIARGYRHLVIAWTGSMRYDGVSGVAEFDGDVAATGEAPTLRDIIRADQLVVELEPSSAAAGADNAGDPDANADLPAGLGAIRRVIARETDSNDRASVESRRYGPDDTGRPALAQLVYLEGSTITADNEQGRLDVPGAGRLLIERRPALEAPGGVDPSAPAAALGSLEGTTLFEWAGAFTALRDDARATMTRSVRLRQLPPGAEHAAIIECERLEAAFAQSAVGGAPMALEQAEAHGAVYAALDQREMIADALIYDAGKALLAAQANSPNMVVLFDRSQPAPLTGAALVWDLARDRVEWTAAGALTVPAQGFVSAPPEAQPGNND